MLNAREVYVTASMIVVGTISIKTRRPVFLKNKVQAISVKAARSWFAAPNKAQMLWYPIIAKR